MKIARPPQGFRILLSPSAKATLESASSSVPRVAQVWDGICERLKYTAHREGFDLGKGRIVMQIDGNAAFGVPKIALTYRVVGDRVEIEKLLIALG